MENASKALIIAGAILVSILLISVGIIIMNAINEPVQQSANSATSQAVEAFNAQFLSYEGTQTGATLRGLIAKVNASNSANPDDLVFFGNDNARPQGGYTTTGVDADWASNKSYNLTLVYDGNGGRVHHITVQAVANNQGNNG